jgi:hypothetical protein
MGKYTIHSLRAANSPRKRNHAGQIDPYGTVTSLTEYAIFKDQWFHLLKHLSVHLSFFLIEPPQRVNHLIGGHILRIAIMTPEKKAAVSAQTAASTKGKQCFHLPFLRI